jgi:molybdate transport system substrate-binding protein
MKVSRILQAVSTAAAGLAVGCVMLATGAAAQTQLPGTSVDIAAAKPGEVRVLVSNGLRAPLEAVRAQAERAIGHKLVIQYGSSRGMEDTIASGQPFEVVVVTPSVLDDVADKGVLRPGRTTIARVPGGIGQHGGTPHDISTPEGLKAALLGAKSIRFLGTGAVRPTVDKAFAALGVSQSLPSINPTLPGGASPPATLAPGEYELVLNLASEHLVQPPGSVYLGPFPQSLQAPAEMVAALGAKGDAVAGQALIDFLMGPALDAPLAASRMTR